LKKSAQKTFAPFGAVPLKSALHQIIKSFLVLFFKKEPLF